MRALHLITFGFLSLLAGCATNHSEKEQLLKHQTGDYLLSDTNAVPGSIYEVGIYVIAPGDTFAKIAYEFEISLDDLMKLNPRMRYNYLLVGQKVRIYERKRD